MTFNRTLQVTLDPSKIDHLVVDDGDLDMVMGKLKVFDDALYFKKQFIPYSFYEKLKDSIQNIYPGLGRNSLRHTMWDFQYNAIWNSVYGFKTIEDKDNGIWEKLLASVTNSEWSKLRMGVHYKLGELMKRPEVNIDDRFKVTMFMSSMYSTANAVFASAYRNMVREEYDELVVKETPNRPTFDQARRLFSTYNWFSDRGLFPHRSIKKGQYILVSWKNSDNIQQLTNVY